MSVPFINHPNVELMEGQRRHTKMLLEMRDTKECNSKMVLE